MPRIPRNEMLNPVAHIRIRQESLPGYDPGYRESPAAAIHSFAKSSAGMANMIGNLMDTAASAVDSFKGASEKTAMNEIKLNEYKANAAMQSYAKEHPDDYANFGEKQKEFFSAYDARNQELMDGMRFRARSNARDFISLSREKSVFDTRQLARKSQVEFGIKDLGEKSTEACDLGLYDDARKMYLDAGKSQNEGEEPLLSPQQVKVGVDYINSRQQFDQFSGFISADGFMEVFE